MPIKLKSRLSSFIARTPLAYIPVRVRSGMARGARWTLLPHSAYWRGYEPDVDAAIRAVGPLKGAACWDLGAHFGIYTIGLAMAVGSSGEVASFEPDPVSHARCARHIRMNRLSWVKLFKAGVGEVAAQQNLIIAGGLGSTSNHLRYEDEPVAVGEKLVEIKILVLDDLVATGQIRPPVFIKVDVEGHGAKALHGARQTLERHRPTLVMSFHSHFETDDTRSLLEPLGYRCFDTENQELPWPAIVFRTVRLVASRP
jgi:FkbM family methyltransferase